MSRIQLLSEVLLVVAASATAHGLAHRMTRELHVPFEYTNADFTDDGQPLFESDMLLTPQQREAAIAGDRQAESNLWTSPVHYAINSSSSGDRAAIEAAINHWRQLTCIEFSEVAAGSTTPHLAFFKDGGCWSYVGQAVAAGGQPLSIGDGCTHLGTVAHEIGHAMGLQHQQSRPDRDQYVIINTANIQTGREGNFDKASGSSSHGVPYDYTSNMHYGSFYFSANGQKTIQTVDIKYEGLIGTRNGLSHRDQNIINLMYRCTAACPQPLATCLNGGFVDKTCTCRCPANASGDKCQTLSGDYYPVSQCGADNVDTEGTITSPNYPQNFPKNVVCFWTINAPAGKRVRITVTDMKMLERAGSECYFDYLSLRYTGDIYKDDQLGCNQELQGQTFTSTGERFIVKFKSGDYGWYRGFSATVKFVDDPNAVTTTVAPEGAGTNAGTNGATGGTCTGA